MTGSEDQGAARASRNAALILAIIVACLVSGTGLAGWLLLRAAVPARNGSPPAAPASVVVTPPTIAGLPKVEVRIVIYSEPVTGVCPVRLPPEVTARLESLFSCDIQENARYLLGPVGVRLQPKSVESATRVGRNVVEVVVDVDSAVSYSKYIAAQSHRKTALVVDGAIISTPVTQNVVDPEMIEIVGTLTAAEADQIARLLRGET